VKPLFKSLKLIFNGINCPTEIHYLGIFIKIIAYNIQQGSNNEINGEIQFIQ